MNTATLKSPAEGTAQCPTCSVVVADSSVLCPECRGLMPRCPGNESFPEKKKLNFGFVMSGCAVFAIGFALIKGLAPTELPSAPVQSIPQPSVQSSPYDGSVVQVERWLQDNLKDPDSFKAIEWSKVVKTDSDGFMVHCKYRAKNSFGGYVVESKMFILDAKGNVTGAVGGN